ncbi:MAG: DUF4259 domain-containing protein [Sphingomonadaceae bacterium]
MGAWGHQFDENDSALDWIADFEAAPSWSQISDVFEAVFAADDADYVDLDDCSAALVAGEIVAAGLGQPSDRLVPSIVEWAKANSIGAIALKADAIKSASLVKSESELSELWKESDDAAAWTATVDDLLSRLI